MASLDNHIKAFNIFKKYTDDGWPLHAEHDIIYCHVDPNEVSVGDLEELEGLSWHADGHDPDAENPWEDLGDHFYHFT